MNQFQSSLYLLTESVGAVSMVSVQQIVRQQNLDYLEHLCTFVDRMNLNPIWFQNEEPSNKLKILEIYQLAITYSKNLSNSYKKEIEQKEANLLKLRNQQKEKIASIRNHKDDYHNLKEKYKLKKHQIYKYTYETLRNKLKDEQDERQYRRVEQSRKTSLTPQIIYYYPNQNDHIRYDPNTYPQQPHHFPISHHPNHPPPHPHQQNYPWPSHSNPQFINPHTQNYSPNPMVNTIDSNNRYNQYLDTGNLQHPQPQPQPKPQPQPQQQNNNLAKSTKINIKYVMDQSQQQRQEDIQTSQIIASGQKVITQNISKSSKHKNEDKKLPLQKSFDKSYNNKKRQSIQLNSRDDEDEFGDLTVNSKKRDGSIKLMERNSDVEYDQDQFDSIAHIKLTTDSSNKNIPIAAPNRFQSKIQTKQQKKNPPLPSQSNKREEPPSMNYLDSNSSKDIQEMGFSSSIMKSKFSKNNKQVQGQKLFDASNPPKRNSQNKKSAVKNQQSKSRKSSLDQNQKAVKNVKSQLLPDIDFDGEKMYKNRPTRNKHQEDDSSQLRSIVKTVQLSDKGVDIYHSNVGKQVERSFQKSRQQQSVDIFTSNMGSGNSKASGQKMFVQKPKRVSQIEAPPQPQIKKSKNNQLKVSIAESQEIKNSNRMLYSNAVSINFNKQSKTPPKLQKQQQEQQKNDYEDDFEDIDLQHSRLPISHQNQKAKQKQKQIPKSEVNIAVPTNKQIPKQKYAKLANQTFQLKKQNMLAINNGTNLLRSSNSNLAESDNFFDQILQIPMNSKIAKRPSAIQNKLQSKIYKNASPQPKQPSLGIIRSPSIHVIDPSGHMQRIQQRGVQQREKAQGQGSNSLKLPSNSSKSIKQKIQQQDRKKMSDKIQQKDKDQQDDEIDFNLMEKSSVGNKQENKKILDIINQIETEPPVYKDSKKFDDKMFDKLIFDKFKVQGKNIKTAQKWEEIQSFFKQQYQKSKVNHQQKSQNISTPKHKKKDSFYDDLEYSQSNIKVQSKVESRNFKNQGKKNSNIQVVKDMTESITIKDIVKAEKVVEQQNNRKGSIENRYSRGSKPKAEIKSEIRKNINEGKNAYDVDDPLNVAVFQNKKLLEKKEDQDDDDF